MGEGLKRARAAAKATRRKAPQFATGVTTEFEKQFKIAGGCIVVSLAPDCALDPLGSSIEEEWIWRVHKKGRHPARDPSGSAKSMLSGFTAGSLYWIRHGLAQTTPPTQWDAP